MAKAAPGPILRALDQTASNRIAVDISQFFDALLLAPDIEIVIALLPEMLVASDQPSSDGLLQRLDRGGQCASSRLAHEHVDMFRHHHVCGDKELVTEARSLESALE